MLLWKTSLASKQPKKSNPKILARRLGRCFALTSAWMHKTIKPIAANATMLVVAD
jgi:hypothetical protein